MLATVHLLGNYRAEALDFSAHLRTEFDPPAHFARFRAFPPAPVGQAPRPDGPGGPATGPGDAGAPSRW
ncbi:hypothetical protein GCM10020366_30920 [Saccharopolyspora gregorii]|uniref:Uncharacterized protein n=1 Tax=Saccharopolyspora gregorii TaxID=33914 RepID=A0ABP6RSJ8_9PSEU